MLGFKTKKEAACHLRAMLENSSLFLGDILGPDAHALLTKLIQRHPQAKEKIGKGIRYFFIAFYQSTNRRCFWIERVDGSRTPFSYLSALNGKLSVETQIKSAFRYAVKDQLKRAKEDFFDKYGDLVPCEVSGEFLDRHSCHIDHVPPLTFDVLVKCFMATKGLKFSQRLLTANGDCNSHYAFKDKHLSRSFQRYHRRVAVLQMTSARVNQKNKMMVPKVRRPVILM